MKQIKLLAIAIVLSVSASATDLGELTENWLQSPEAAGQSQQIGNGTSDPTVERDNDTPVGEGLLLLTILAGGYGVLRSHTGRRRYGSGNCKKLFAKN